MDLTFRQTEILDNARNNGSVSVENLAAAYNIAPQTIRRDLNELCQRGLLARVHGGAIPARSISNMAYEDRRMLAAPEKQRIGKAAASLIPNNCSIMINIGTTTEQVARSLYHHRNLFIISNNFNVINSLSGSPEKELVVAGGTVRQFDGGIVGDAAVTFMSQFKADYAVIGASAIDQDGAVLDFDFREVLVARTLIANARQTILVSDASKFSRSAPVRICDMSAISAFVTDEPPTAQIYELCANHSVNLLVAPNGGSDRRA